MTPVARKRALIALYLLLSGTLLFVLSLVYANGLRAGGEGLNAFASAKVGLYRQADATKNRDGNFVDPGLHPPMQEWFAAGTTNGLRVGELSLKQRDGCILRRFARRCNIPLIEVPLGVTLAVAVSLMAFGLSYLRLSTRRQAAVRLAGLSLAGALFAVGMANATYSGESFSFNLTHAKVGLYRQYLAGDDPGLRGLSPHEQFVYLQRGGRLTLEQHPACYYRLFPFEGCNRTLFEAPLWWALSAGGFGLVLALCLAILPSHQSRIYETNGVGI